MNINFKDLHSPLSILILKEYEKLKIAINLIPLETYFQRKFKGTGGSVSVVNLMAYQIGWGKLLISWYEQGRVNKIVEMPGEGFKSWDYTSIAKHFYQKYEKYSFKKLDEELLKVVTKIINIVENEYITGNLDKQGVWEWCTLKSGKKWSLSKWIKVNTAAPFKRARTILKQSLLEIKITPFSYPTLPKIIKFSIGNPTKEKIADILKSYNEDNRYLIGGFVSNNLVGICGIEVLPEEITIKHISVAENWRSQNIGRQLIKYIIEHFQPKSLFTETDDEAIGFYEALGFKCLSLKKEDVDRYKCVLDCKS